MFKWFLFSFRTDEGTLRFLIIPGAETDGIILATDNLSSESPSEEHHRVFGDVRVSD